MLASSRAASASPGVRLAAPGRSRTALSDAMNAFLNSRIALVDPRTAPAGSRTTGQRFWAPEQWLWIQKSKLLTSSAASVAGVVLNENYWFYVVNYILPEDHGIWKCGSGL